MLSEPMLISCDGGHAACGCLGPWFLLVIFPLAIRFEEALLLKPFFLSVASQCFEHEPLMIFSNGERRRVASRP